MAIDKFNLDQLWAAAVGVIARNLQILQHVRQKSRWPRQIFFRQMMLTHRTRFRILAQMFSDARAAEIVLICTLYWIF
jgi:N-dimethylarginine dimethylaminohydrolase